MARKAVKVGLAIAVALAVIGVALIAYVERPLRLLSEAEAVELAGEYAKRDFRAYMKEETLELLSANLLSIEELLAEENFQETIKRFYLIHRKLPNWLWVVEFECEIERPEPVVYTITRIQLIIDAYTGELVLTFTYP